MRVVQEERSSQEAEVSTVSIVGRRSAGYEIRIALRVRVAGADSVARRKPMVEPCDPPVDIVDVPNVDNLVV